MKRIVRNSEYFPKRPIWLVFDLSNGHAPVVRYVWWFDTRKDAREHIAWQKSRKHYAELSEPVKFAPVS